MGFYWSYTLLLLFWLYEIPQADQLIGLEHDASDRAETVWHPR